MNIIKKLVVIILLISTVVYYPMAVEAAYNADEAIIEEAQNYLQSSTPIILQNNPSTSSINALNSVHPFNAWIYRAGNIPITRSNTSTGITLTITQSSGYRADVSVFTSDGSTLIGHTEWIESGTLSTASWTASELGSYTDVLIFITCYRNITYNIYGSVTY